MNSSLILDLFQPDVQKKKRKTSAGSISLQSLVGRRLSFWLDGSLFPGTRLLPPPDGPHGAPAVFIGAITGFALRNDDDAPPVDQEGGRKLIINNNKMT